MLRDAGAHGVGCSRHEFEAVRRGKSVHDVDEIDIWILTTLEMLLIYIPHHVGISHRSVVAPERVQHRAGYIGYSKCVQCWGVRLVGGHIDRQLGERFLLFRGDDASRQERLMSVPPLAV